MARTNDQEKQANCGDMECARCGVSLEVKFVTFAYVGATFPVSLYTCPQCGFVYVPGVLARGSMLHVQRALEDK